MCCCMQATLQAERTAAAAAIASRYTQQLHADLGKLRHCTFETLDRARPLAPISWNGKSFSEQEQRKALVKALGIARDFDPQGIEGLFFYGPPGSGKSHLAAAIVNAACATGVPARYGTVSSLLRLVQDGFSDGSASQRLEALINCPLLVIDDLGTENTTQWSEMTLFELVTGRDNAERPTIYTSNYPVDQLNDPRIRSRIKGSCTCIELVISDYRALRQASL